MTDQEMAAFADAAGQALDLRLGDNTAQQAISDAFLATFFKAFPHLIADMQQSLDEAAQHHREQLGEEETLVQQMFDRRIAQANDLLDAMQGKLDAPNR